MVLRAIAAAALAFPLAAFALDARDVPGEYELHGRREMAGALALRADDTYRASFSYGAADWAETGRWSIDHDAIVLTGGRVSGPNPYRLPAMLPSGTRLAYDSGRLEGNDENGPLAFVDPNRTPSNAETGEPGEGRMRVTGTVAARDADELVVNTGSECMMFDATRLAPAVLERARVGTTIDVEMAYSAIIGGGSCP